MSIRSGEMKDKIKQLLILSVDGGATPSEKDAAFLMAQKLMLKHGIEEDELEENKEVQEVYAKPVTDYKNLKFWELSLAEIISENFRCLYYRDCWQGAYDKTNINKKRIVFFGIREDVEIAAYVYEYACKAIIENANDYIGQRNSISEIPKKSINPLRNTFMVGYTDGLKSKFVDQVKSNQLVITVPKLAKDEYDKIGLTDRKFSMTITQDKDALAKGYVKGVQFSHSVQIK